MIDSSRGNADAANASACPSAVGATIGSSTYGGSGPYASYVLVESLQAKDWRLTVDVENISGQRVVVVLDDGKAAVGAAPTNAALFILDGGSAVPSQGGSWSSDTFKGRVQVWAASDPGAGYRPSALDF